MDKNTKKYMQMRLKKYKKEKIQWEPLLIVTVLGVVGFLILGYSGIFGIRTHNDTVEYLSKNGLIAVFSLFFISICFYCWYITLKEQFSKPKKAVLFLLKKEDKILEFINEKGKLLEFYGNFEAGKYYEVMIKNNEILEVLNESVPTFIVPEVKKSYWLNYYTPFGIYEDIFLLPIVYVILLPGILSILLSKWPEKIFGIIYSAVPAFLIIYDLVYKLKPGEKEEKNMSFLKFNNSLGKILEIISIIPLIAVDVFLGAVYFVDSDLTIKLCLTPFFICFVAITIQRIAVFVNIKKIPEIMEHVAVITFILFWFGFIGAFTFAMIKADGFHPAMLIFILPFVIAGIYMVKATFFNNKKGH